MKKWYDIKNQSDAVAELSIYDDIGTWGVSAKDFLADLQGVGDRKIKMRINSGGGSVFDAIAIHNLLKAHAPGVDAYIDSVAASAATIVALGANTVHMASNALFMIHKSSGIEAGNADNLREYADLLDKVDATIISTYQKKTGKSEEEVKAAMGKNENWFTAQSAKEFGFVDEITEPLEVAASFDMTRFRNPPKASFKNTEMNLRAFLITALKLTDPTDKPLTDEAITDAFTNALQSERDESKRIKDDLTTKVTAEGKKFTDIVALIKPLLELKDEQLPNILTDATIIPAAFTAAANKKAVAIAAAQGVPPVITDPADPGDEGDAAKVALKAAQEETDPRKRAIKFAAYSEKLKAKGRKK